MAAEEEKTPELEEKPSGEVLTEKEIFDEKDPSRLQQNINTLVTEKEEAIKSYDKNLQDARGKIGATTDLVKTKEASISDLISSHRRESEGIQKKIEKLASPKYVIDNKKAIVAGSALLIAAIAGPAYMRLGAAGMMNSLKGALEGFHAGNKERFDMEMERYHEQLSMIESQWNRQHSEYQAALKAHEGDLATLTRVLHYQNMEHDHILTKKTTTIAEYNRQINLNARLMANLREKSIGRLSKEKQKERESALKEKHKSEEEKLKREKFEKGKGGAVKPPDPSKVELPKPSFPGQVATAKDIHALMKALNTTNEEQVKAAWVKSGGKWYK